MEFILYKFHKCNAALSCELLSMLSSKDEYLQYEIKFLLSI